MKMKSLMMAVAATAAVMTGLAAEPEPERQLVWPEGKMPGPQTNVVNYAPYYMWWAPTNQTTDAILICCSGGGYHYQEIRIIRKVGFALSGRRRGRVRPRPVNIG